MLIIKDNMQKNCKRADHDYQVKDKYYKAAQKVNLVSYTTSEYETIYEGQFKITWVGPLTRSH